MIEFISLTCDNDSCNKKFDRTTAKHNEYLKKGSKLTFCSLNCVREGRRLYNERICIHVECGKPFKVASASQKFCSTSCSSKHNRVKQENEQALDRFWSKVVKQKDGCWMWTGYVNKQTGYGRATVPGVKARTTHRISWILTNGPIVGGLFVCHSCDVRACVNPAHLWLGTSKENLQDASRKGRLVKPKWKQRALEAEALLAFYSLS